MLFDFESFIGDLRDNQEKKETVEKYEKYFGNIDPNIKEQKWYIDYIQNFETVDYNIPEELKEDFDWKLLMQLVAGSFSSDWVIDFVEWQELPEFIISVYSWDQSVVKKVSELWGFQILRLYEIYIEEQMNLQILMEEEEKEKEAIEAQRKSKLERWEILMENLQQKQEKEKEDKEKEGKLKDLYEKL